MTIEKALISVGLSSVVCGAVGSGIGFCVGRFIPELYRLQFRAEELPNFDPVRIGIVLGLIQGLAAGTAIGVIVVVAVTWCEVRMAEIAERREAIRANTGR